MEIIAHRGFWINVDEKNSYASIKRAFENSFGIETDIRDYKGKLVISHNIADEKCISVEEIFKLYKEYDKNLTLALNVKADGIQVLLKPLLTRYNISNYFLFDMSIPELVVNEKENLQFYTRCSDIEHECVMLDKANGIWLDSFYDSNYVTLELILDFVNKKKKICIVSPELHGKQYNSLWKILKDNNLQNSKYIILCTDKPNEAKEYFYGKN